MSSQRSVIVCFALLAVLIVPIYPHFVSPNEFSRWGLTASIVERGSVELGWLLPLLGPRLEDLSESEGRVYSNKAPGGSLAAIPAYAIARALAGPPSPSNLRFTLYFCRLLVSSVPVLLLALLFLYTARRSEAPIDHAGLVLFALMFGTPLFTYGLLFFSHALTALLLFAAWVLLYIETRSGKANWEALAAGACIGLSILSEYTTLIPALILIAGVSATRRRRRIRWIVLGGAPFGAVLLVYQRIAFGSFFTVSSGRERFAAFQDLAGEGLFGIGLPSFRIALNILLDPSRGLLIFSPFLLLFPLWMWRSRRSLPAPALGTLALVPLSMFVLIAGYPNWHGGWTTGMRYLVPVIPFLVFPMFHGNRSSAESLLVGGAATAIVVTTAVFPFIPPGVQFPWTSFAGPLLARPLFVPHWTDLVLPNQWSALLSAAILITALILAFRCTSRWRAGVIWALLGGLVWFVVPRAILRAFPLEAFDRLQRAYIEEVYFEQEGALAREFPETTLPPGIDRRRRVELSLPPSSWPFKQQPADRTSESEASTIDLF